MAVDPNDDNEFPDSDEDLENQERALKEESRLQRNLEQRYEHLAEIKQREADDARAQGDLQSAIALEKEAIELVKKAERCAELAASDIRKEHELERQEHVQHLAILVRDPQKTDVASLESTVNTLTGSLQNATYHELAEAADGSVADGKLLREHITFLGAEIKHSLKHLEGLSREAIVHFVQQVVEFTAAVMTIAEHIAWFYDLFVKVKPILEPFIFA